jgi:hypothetical protein
VSGWRLALLDFGGHPPDPARARELGTREHVRSIVDSALADIVWNGGRGTLTELDATLELEIGESDPVLRIEVVARGVEGAYRKVARPLVVHLCRVAGYAALDLETHRYLDLDAELDPSLD